MKFTPDPPRVVSLSGKEVRIYHVKRNSYELRYKVGKATRRETRASVALAETRAKEILESFAENKRIVPEAELEMCRVVAAEAARAGVSLLEVWEHWKRSVKKPASLKFGGACAEFLEEQRRKKLHPTTIATNASRLRSVAWHLPALRPLNELTASDLDAAIQKAAEDPITQKNLRRVLIQLWRWASRNGFVELRPGGQTVAEDTPVPMVTPSDPEILCPSEMRLIWQWVQAHQPQHLPALALAAYCGIRDAELSRLQWSNINLTNRTVQLPSHVTKTKRRRMVEIPAEVAPTLERIYRLWRWTPGTPLRGTGFDVAVANARAAHALTTKRNGFRKSFVTYAVALGQKSVSQIAEECGHSESVLQSTYKGLATKEAAEAWFTSCCPPEPGREL